MKLTPNPSPKRRIDSLVLLDSAHSSKLRLTTRAA